MLTRPRNDQNLLEEIQKLTAKYHTPYNTVVENYRKLAQESVQLRGSGKGEFQENFKMALKQSTETLNDTILVGQQKIFTMTKNNEALQEKIKEEEKKNEEKVSSNS